MPFPDHRLCWRYLEHRVPAKPAGSLADGIGARALVLLKEEQGQMKAFKRPIPKEWWPDLSKPYEERYPSRFPGE